MTLERHRDQRGPRQYDRRAAPGRALRRRDRSQSENRSANQLAVRGEIFARAYQIHGRGLSGDNLGNLNLVSGIEATRTTRLGELWYEQHFDYRRLRIGQQTIGTEFFSPERARLFVNATFGWPNLPSVDLPSGGPAYPLGTPAIRVRVDPKEGVTLFLGVFNGDPTGAGVGGSQLRDASGTAFRTVTALAIARSGTTRAIRIRTARTGLAAGSIPNSFVTGASIRPACRWRARRATEALAARRRTQLLRHRRSAFLRQ